MGVWGEFRSVIKDAMKSLLLLGVFALAIVAAEVQESAESNDGSAEAAGRSKRSTYDDGPDYVTYSFSHYPSYGKRYGYGGYGGYGYGGYGHGYGLGLSHHYGFQRKHFSPFLPLHHNYGYSLYPAHHYGKGHFGGLHKGFGHHGKRHHKRDDDDHEGYGRKHRKGYGKKRHYGFLDYGYDYYRPRFYPRYYGGYGYPYYGGYGGYGRGHGFGGYGRH